MKKIFTGFILLLFLVPAISQDKKEPAKEPEKKAGEVEQVTQNIYSEITLEDFETNQYTNSNIKFTQSKEQQGSVAVRDQYPAEYNNSKKYLGVKVYAKKGDTFQIFPAKPLEIKQYCKSISMWVYGKKFAGELSIMLQDVNGDNYRISFGTATFLGWKKITVALDSRIKQQDEYLEKEKYMRLLHIQYRATNDTLHPEWQYFYIDDITATVREKYKDRQNDDW